MVDQDAAFLWETEALRTMTTATTGQPGPSPTKEPEARIGWVTLREASEATGIPVATLRSWIRKKRIPSVIDETPNGARRLVPLDRVQARARALGREIGDVVDIRPHAAPTAAPADSSPPPGTMIVPIEAWDKMLLQLGNLHEAGQQLAEARERAARAETEAMFLKERLAEVRSARDEALAAASAEKVATEAPPQSQGTSPTRPSFTAYLWRSATSRLRRA
jgi:hypothetical protein